MSPGLLGAIPPQVTWDFIPDDYFQKCSDWILNMEHNPEKLLEFFNLEQQFILGKYFEKHLQFIFKYFDQFSLLEMGLQVEKENRTIGEIDFIYKELVNNSTIHLEVAVKYYMGYRSSAKHTMWIGPNGMDNLANKIQKFTKQLTMSGFADQLADLNPSSFKKEVLLKGYFFNHIKTRVLPHFHNKNVLTGVWLYFNELNKIINSNRKYIIVPKQYWLGFYLDKALEIFNGINIIEVVHLEIKRVGKGILIAELNETEDLIEAKFMVAPDFWPKSAP
jgi:hypothetical protein